MRRQLQDQREWHRVFAWLPVTTHGGLRVWLEPVERRLWGSAWFDDYYHYRLPGDLWDDRAMGYSPNGGDCVAGSGRSPSSPVTRVARQAPQSDRPNPTPQTIQGERP